MITVVVNRVRGASLVVIGRPAPIAVLQLNRAIVQFNGSGSKQRSLSFSYGDVTTQIIYQALSGQRITKIELGFDVAFNVASSISVGDGTNTQRLMDTGQNNPLVTGIYSSHPFYKYLANTNVLLTINAGIGATQGSGTVIIYYE